MIKKYIVVILFFLGIIIAMINYDLTLPAVTDSTGPYYHGIRGRNQISLTVNVDWGEEYLPEMLEVMNNKNIKATFFVTGNWAEKNSELLCEIAEKGHEIGNHGFEHQHPERISQHALIELIKKNEELIFDLCAQRTKLFAPPYGEVNDNIVRTARSVGYKTIMWSADTIDWQRPAPELIVQRAVNKINDGGIILMHPTEPSLTALPQIIDTLKKRGYNFVVVSELINS